MFFAQKCLKLLIIYKLLKLVKFVKIYAVLTQFFRERRRGSKRFVTAWEAADAVEAPLLVQVEEEY